MDYIIFLLISLIGLFGFFGLLFYIDKSKRNQTWKQYFSKQAQQMRERDCNHEKWDAELSTRTLQCRKCLKRAYLYHYAEKLFKS